MLYLLHGQPFFRSCIIKIFPRKIKDMTLKINSNILNLKLVGKISILQMSIGGYHLPSNELSYASFLQKKNGSQHYYTKKKLKNPNGLFTSYASCIKI